MTDEWYYWHDSEVLGPFSGRRLADLAFAGTLLPTDTVWKGDVEGGVPAGSVENLFPSAPTNTAPTTPPARGLEPGITGPGVAGNAIQSPVCPPTAAREVPASWFCGPSATTAPTKARAVAGKGAVIVGQDGISVKYRKKCTVCGHEDSSWKTAAITKGTTRVSFFCPKCRKSRAVEIHGYVS